MHPDVYTQEWLWIRLQVPDQDIPDGRQELFGLVRGEAVAEAPERSFENFPVQESAPVLVEHVHGLDQLLLGVEVS